MIRYTSQHQLRFEDFKTPFDQNLLPSNRWVILASVIPWDELAQVYHRQMSAGLGRGAVDTRLIIGALIVKHLLKLDDREAIATLQENIYLQYFVGFSSFQTNIAFDPSLFVTLRKRMGITEFDDWSLAVIAQIESLEAAQNTLKNDDNKDNKKNKDTNSNKLNTNSNKLNTNGNELNTNGNELNTNGNELNTNGNELNTNGNELNTNGNELNTNSNELNTNGNELNTNSNELNTNSNELNTNSNELNTNSNELNTNSNELNTNSNELEAIISLADTLIIDTTAAEQKIKYPTDLGLLNDTRLFLEDLIDTFYKTIVTHNKDNSRQNKPIIVLDKPRDYRQVARKEYLTLALKRRKSAKEIRRVNKKQLIYIERNTRYVNELRDILVKNDIAIPFTKSTHEKWETSQLIYQQQKEMIDKKTNKCANRIVSLAQPHVRSIPRGKAAKNIEFGAKIALSVVNKTNRIYKLSWDAYNDGVDLIGQVEAYKKQYNKYPKLALADKIYLTKKNRDYLKEHNIQHRGKALGKSKPIKYTHVQQQQANQRNHVEGQFGTAKDAYDLDKVKAKTAQTSESWIANTFFILNIVRLLKIAISSAQIIAIAWIYLFCAKIKQAVKDTINQQYKIQNYQIA